MYNKQSILASIFTLMASSTATASIQGELGSTSTASTVVSLEIVDRININGINDIDLGQFNGAEDLVGGSAFCVFRNGGDDYELTISDAESIIAKPGNKDKFLLSSDSAQESVEFSVMVDDDDDASNGSLITKGATVQFSGSKEIDCTKNGENASIEVRILASDLIELSTGSDYSGTLVLNVAPI